MMRIIILATFLTRLIAQNVGPAPIIGNNVPGTAYVAALTAGPGPAMGSVQISGSSNGTGVVIDLSWNRFDIADAKEYTYHIHQNPVPADGNCNATGGHLDKYGVGEDFVCDPSRPDLCQLGDLSGKHGSIQFNDEKGIVNLHYVDNYLSTNPNNTAFFGNLSIVVHKKSDNLRLNCGNFAALNVNPSATTVSSSAAIVSSSATASSHIVTSSNVATSSGIGPSTSATVGAGPSSTTRSSDGYAGRVGMHLLGYMIVLALAIEVA